MNRLAPALALLALLASACGEPEPLPPEHWMRRLESGDSTLADEAVEELGKWGRRDPARVVALLERALKERGERVILGVRLTPDPGTLAQKPDPMHALQLLSLALRQHLLLADYAVLKVQSDDDGVDAYVHPLPGTQDLEAALARLAVDAARAGRFELRAELPPPSLPTAERPVSPWSGDAASYAAWLAAETKRFADAEAAGKRYEPGEPGQVLARRTGPGGGEGPGLVPLLVPAAASMDFTERDLVFEPRDDAGFPALFLNAAPAREAEFRAFLKAHAGLTLWLVLDGAAVASTPLPADPGTRVAFRLKAAEVGAGRTTIAKWTALAQAGRYGLPVTASPIPRRTLLSVDDPLCRAVVSVGPPAEPMLDALVAKDPAWATLVSSLKDGILRMRTQHR